MRHVAAQHITPVTTNVFVILPAFNEGMGISSLLGSLDFALSGTQFPYKIIVVNDGSTDDTRGILRKSAERIDALHVIDHEVNVGLGGAIRDGLYYASLQANNNDVIITMDADETHAPALALRLVGLIREGFDVVIASRYQPGARVVGVPWSRNLLSLLASVVCRALFPIRGVRDYTCGYRAYRASTLKAALSAYGESFVDQDGFQCMVDILLKLKRLDCVFGEIPIVLRYDKKQGLSKMRVAKTARDTIKLLLKRRFLAC